MTATMAIQCDVCGTTVPTTADRSEWSESKETMDLMGNDLTFSLHACPDCDVADIDGAYDPDDDSDAGGE